MEWMTSQDPPDGVIDTPQETVLLQGPGSVMRACGMEPAMVPRDERGDDPLIETDEAE